ncbi:TetR/AcrR family transcriptional regulator [Ekhidna sp.]|uniref:TetR/AcrR family transcriptional regulator n=1 Tax=Ekhidna sp. TaxID=2608089 RepID=UPI003CCBF18D
MTEKQEKIVSSALRLFAEQGYASTSTSKVAKEAGVSEGLIFRHFKNKEGLLQAILSQGQEKVSHMFRSLESVNDPKEVIRRIIELPFSIEEDQKAFWKLLYALKWQANVYDDTMSIPIKQVLVPAFEKLNYSNPAAEAESILILIDGLAVAVLLRKPEQIGAIKQSILNKYHL